MWWITAVVVGIFAAITHCVAYRIGVNEGERKKRHDWQAAYERDAARYFSQSEMRYEMARLAERRFKELTRELLSVPLERPKENANGQANAVENGREKQQIGSS